MSPDELGVVDPEAVLAHHGRSFHLASRFLDRDDADRVARLYRFCRYVDDLADEALDASTARHDLDRVERSLAGLVGDPVVDDFRELTQGCPTSLAAARELVAGVRSDLASVRIADEEELMRYCYRVAGTVGVLMCGVLDVHDPEAHAFAVDLGMAMQLTNICRDVSEDAASDRRYLPASLLGEVEPIDLLAPGPDLRRDIAETVGWLLAEADVRYRSGESGLVHLPRRARRGIWVASRVYREIGHRLRRRGCRTWHGRVVVPTSRKLVVAAGALAQERRVRERPAPSHDGGLHRALVGLVGTDDLSAAA